MKFLKVLFLTVALILLTEEISFAENIKKEEFYPYTNWLPVVKDSFGNIHAINLDDLFENVNTNNSVKKIWVEIIYSEKSKEEIIQMWKERGLYVKGDENVNRSLSFGKFDCQNKTRGIVSAVNYDKDGNVLNSATRPETLVKMEPIVPGSIEERIFKIACAPLEDIQKLLACINLYLTIKEELEDLETTKEEKNESALVKINTALKPFTKKPITKMTYEEIEEILNNCFKLLDKYPSTAYIYFLLSK